MKCVADRDYKVVRRDDPYNDEILALECAYCKTFRVSKRLTPQPRTSTSGLGRYNRMRGQIVAHLHAEHRAELEAANEQTRAAWAEVERRAEEAQAGREAYLESMAWIPDAPWESDVNPEPVRAICPTCRRRFWAHAEEAIGGPVDPLTGAYLVDDLCSELAEPPDVEGRHEWHLWRVLDGTCRRVHLIGPDRFYQNGPAICGGQSVAWVRVDADPMPSDAPNGAGIPLCSKCATLSRYRAYAG